MTKQTFTYTPLKMSVGVLRGIGPGIQLTRLPSGDSVTYIIQNEDEMNWLIGRLTQLRDDHFKKEAAHE